MKNPFLYLAINNYISKLIVGGAFKNVEVKNDGGPYDGYIFYDVALGKNSSTNKIPPVEDAYTVVNNTIAGMLIMEGYCVINSLEDTFVVSNDKGDTYFVQGNSCDCADRFSPCKHVLFSQWYMTFRKNQVKLLHKAKN
jgi:hypothetical protein